MLYDTRVTVFANRTLYQFNKMGIKKAFHVSIRELAVNRVFFGASNFCKQTVSNMKVMISSDV